MRKIKYLINFLSQNLMTELEISRFFSLKIPSFNFGSTALLGFIPC